MTKVSIIIPVFNGENYIEKCLKSIKNQTFKDFEALIINDGSTDNTKSIIETFLDDERFKLFNRTNHGIGSSRNYGISKSSGKYICFIDSDDYVSPLYLEKLFNKIDKEKLDIVVCNFIEESEFKGVKKNVEIKCFNNTTIRETPELLIHINKSPWNKIYRKSAIKNIKFPEDLKYEDLEFVCYALLNSKLGYVNDFLNYYLIHSSSETTTMDKKVFDTFILLDRIREYYKNESSSVQEYLNQMIIQILTMLNIQQQYQKDKKIANEFINKSFQYFEDNIPNYKHSDYFNNINFLKALVKRNKTLTKTYTDIKRIANNM